MLLCDTSQLTKNEILSKAVLLDHLNAFFHLREMLESNCGVIAFDSFSLSFFIDTLLHLLNGWRLFLF